jgi:hypothetical protein
LRRLGVRPNLIGAVINLIRERAEQVHVSRILRKSPLIPRRSVLSLQQRRECRFHCHAKSKDFPQERLKAKVISTVALA